ncbi:UNVERIFIED_CONTAM: UDP-glucuronate:xylan alpha-glucuronosyltransferase 2 [Sesamum calycinum]|uniref:UDP-glucuronate:xylan alpha-glucuronosyltransferase 2 n=1 Tax=Sesamum calycinum TaxID=2727403 RepID=A0AAW2QN98_9LAMI
MLRFSIPGGLRLRCNNPSPEPPPDRNPTRPHPPPRHLHFPTQTRRPFPGRLEAPVHYKDPEPQSREKLLQRIQLQQFRLWQLTHYDKIIFIDSDIVVLRNLDVLFHFPQMSATGNDGSIFNSGVMVIEPSNCTFRMLMNRRKEIVSYNGGDQGFLNEVFVWWHRLPRRVNFLKNFWSNTSSEATVKNQLFGSDPPKLYSIHYLGLKPWLCYRDYDCNWDIPEQRVYASDVAHARWWRLHDTMDEGLKRFCGLSERRKIELEWDRKVAGKMGLSDRHWEINVTDPRRFL